MAPQQDQSGEPEVGATGQQVTPLEFRRALERELSRAMQGVVDDLRGQISEIVQEQQSDAGPGTRESSGSSEQPDAGGSQAAFLQAAQALRETFIWLGRTLRALLETVRALLKSVGLLLRAILSAPFQGIRALWQFIQRYVRDRIVNAIASRVRQWIQAAINWILSWVRPAERAEGAVRA